MPFLDRRAIIKALAASAAAGGMTSVDHGTASAAGSLRLGPPEPFSFERLQETARQLVEQPYRPSPRPSPEIVDKIDYETWGKISFDTNSALFAEGPGRFPVSFFHLGKFFPKAVEMSVVENGRARQIISDESYFDMPADSVARQLPRGAGFAGFRIQESREGKLDWHKNDWCAFLGGCYLRAIGELYQYGLSMRGVAIDSVVAGKPEEFPDFTKFYIEPERNGVMTVHALLEGPSIAGAYQFQMRREKSVVMDVTHALFLRADVSRFGITPCTSMYWFSETVKPTAIDWRPELHDSDGLAIWNGKGERLWRALNNPPHIMASAFVDENPKGFGLCQRDRNFDHYLDGVYYDRRPTLWVEPLPGPDGQGWGRGAIQLIEIPTNDEILDNIVAMWVPETPMTAGSESHMRYRLHWVADEPFPAPLAKCVATRLGNGGQPGQPRPQGVRKFLIEFLGGPLVDLPLGVTPEADLSTSRGSFTDYRITEAVPDGVPGHWRTQFDLKVDGPDPVELRCFLKLSGRPLTETWLFQYHPF
ncbi:MAG TPA: glucan biosynthesis protein D [Beijerinckiaceae bacterium]|nr:glucan biosynthesis protein D [Beijerinckiaceae bacterium]